MHVQVLMPTYNGQTYIIEQIESIFRQNIPLEILVRDDGSTDNTINILKKISNEDKRLEFERGNNLGIIKNVESLLKKCTAPYFALSDQDDVWHCNKIETLLNAINQLESIHGKDVPLLVWSDARLINENGEVVNASFWKHSKTPQHWGEKLNEALVFSAAAGCTMLGNQALAKVAIPIPNSVYMHDWWLLIIACSLGFCKAIPHCLTDYRQHMSNTLGATGWNLSTVLSKIMHIQTVRHNIRKTQVQANQLLLLHGNNMSEKNKNICHVWANMPHFPLYKKISLCCKYGFFKPGTLRNLSFLLVN